MNGIRSLEDLVDRLDADLAWRKQELANWGAAINSARDIQQDALLRGAWSMLYAHWEGYVKNAALTYLEYVARQGHTVGQLSDPLAAVALRAAISSAASSTHGTQHTQVVTSIRAGTSKANLPYDRATVKTYSNLKYDTFCEVLWTVGCDPSPHAAIADDVDKLLLKHRNEIAHGKYLEVDKAQWEMLKSRIVPALDNVRTQLANAAMLKSYLQPPVAPTS